MKTKKIYLALFATLGLATIGCQKETEPTLPTSATENASAYIVEYSIDGETHRAVLNSEEEYNALMFRLMALAQEGYEVNVRNGNTVRQENASKDVVVYTTQSESDAVKWTKKMMDDGYEVTVTYDDKTHTFTCVAIK